MQGKNRKQKQQQRQQPKKKQSQKGKIKGSGSYAVPIAALAARVAKMIPKGSFESVGKNIGGRLGRGLAGITGVGDYVVNDIVNPIGAPRKGGAHVQTISNVEYIGDVTAYGNTGFNLSEYSVNAANPAVFPWLSNVSKLYTKYRFKQLLFEYRSTSSDYSSQVGLGSVVMAPQYNIDSASFTTKQQMEAATNAVSFKPSVNSMCGVECAAEDNNMKWYMVRDPATAATMFTDPLSFAVAVNGSSVANGTGLGELWVHYTVDLLEPILATATVGHNGAAGMWANYSTAARAVIAGSFGWGAVVPTDLAKSLYGQDKLVLVQRNVTFEGLPREYYDVCFDTSNGASSVKFYFARTGYYTFTITSKFTTAPTAAPSAPAGMWVAGDLNGVVSLDQAACYSPDRTVVHDTFTLVPYKNGSSCNIVLENGWTGMDLSVLDGSGLNAQGCKVQIVWVPGDK